ncbi:DUF2567 domain-containing protein [Streptomyces sp. Tu 6176]|uniref:DUF2567 domain-containing protein n=1 Tax=Streptomyces sp. Tu 6176 TaxID=1470557 RepID=UPI000D120366|nr:DUF2567 domain-containing protein [Streptomyces sp. Tu 6176]
MSAPLTPPTPPNRRPAPSSSSGEAAGPPAPQPSGPAPQDGPSAEEQEYARTWRAPGSGAGTEGSLYTQDGPGIRAELREAAVVTVAVALGGVLLGLLWLWLAPRVPLVGTVTQNSWAVYLKDVEGEQAIGVDGTFTLLAVGLGVLSAAVVFLLRRRGGVPLVVALCLGGLLGSLLAWRLGVWLGPQQDIVAHARAVGQGKTFSAPLRLGAKGALLAWPLAALVVHLAVTALFGPRDPDPYAQTPAQGPAGDPAQGPQESAPPTP